MLASVLCAFVLAGCGGSGASATPTPTIAVPTETPVATAATTVDRFDEDRAWKWLKYQVDLGPRPAGSPVLKHLAGFIKARLPHGQFEAVPGGLTNVVGKLPGKGKAIVLGAHYDTKDLPGFVGAEDGAGGTAQMLELARGLGSSSEPRTRRRSGSSPSTARRRPTTTTSSAPACAARRRSRRSTRSRSRR